MAKKKAKGSKKREENIRLSRDRFEVEKENAKNNSKYPNNSKNSGNKELPAKKNSNEMTSNAESNSKSEKTETADSKQKSNEKPTEHEKTLEKEPAAKESVEYEILEPQPKQSAFKVLLAALFALIFVTALGYLAYSYISDYIDNSDLTNISLSSILNIDEGAEDILEGIRDQRNQEDERTANETTNTITDETETGETPQIEQPDNAATTFEQGETAGANTQNLTTAQWKANDYKPGEIKKGEYEVVYGDTLWEIAEGAYGDGSQWVQLLQANPDSVGLLPNGQQALIYPGQVLVIP